MSVKSIMQEELEQMDLLGKLAKRMEWEEDNPQYKKRLKAITREGATALDRVKNGGGGAAEAAKVKLTWKLWDAHVGDKHSWESAYPAMLQIVNSTKWKRDPDCPQSQVGKMPARLPLGICYENLCDTWGFFATSSRVVDHTQGWH